MATLMQHASVPADEPETAARVVARILDGEATRFPPGGPEAWMAWSSDSSFQVEFTIRGRALIYEPGKFDWTTDEPTPTHNEVHLAMFVDKSAEDIMAIAKEVGWPAQRSDRAGGQFNLVEVWVEGVQLLEFADPDQAALLRQAVTLENWKATFPS